MSSRTSRYRTTSGRSSDNSSFNSSYRDKSYAHDTDSDQAEDSRLDCSWVSGHIASGEDSANISAFTDCLDIEGDGSPVRMSKSQLHAQSPKRTRRSPRKIKTLHPCDSSPIGGHNTSSGSSGSAPSRREKLYPSLEEFQHHVPSSSPTIFAQSRKPRNIQLNATGRPLQSMQEQSYYTYVHVCAACFIVLVAILLTYFVFPLYSVSTITKTDDISERESILAAFEEQFQTFRQSFPSQSSRFWRVLKATTKALLKQPSPLQPAVLLFAMPDTQIPTGLCLAENFSKLVTQAYNANHTESINALHLMSLPSAKVMKERIEDQMREVLGDRGAKSVVFHHLERVPGEAAMMFHAFCDNENAPYKDSIILFTLAMPEEQLASSTESDSLVEEYLTQLWERDLEIDKYTALMSRVVRNVAYVKTEDLVVLQSQCN